MGGKHHHSNINYKNHGKTALVLLFAMLLSVSIVSAKYIYTISTQNGIITSQKFYFTTDLTGDSKMISTSGENVYQYEVGNENEGDEKATFYLYGGGEHVINFNVRNYYDELRVTEDNIEYTISVLAYEKDKTDGTYGNPTKDIVALTPTSTVTQSGDSYSLEGKSQNSTSFKLTIPANYQDGTNVVVTIASTTPYKKTITLKFTLYHTDQYLLYEVNDSAASPYAELVIMANTALNSNQASTASAIDDDTTTTIIDAPVYVKWSGDLSIDNTNSLTYKYSDGTFTQQDFTDNRMQLSRQLKANESVSLYYFKTDTSKVYKQTRQVVNMSDDTYTININ